MMSDLSEDQHLKMAKLTFTLSHCHKFTNYIMTEVMKKYSQSVFFVNNYELWLNLKKNNDIFNLESVDINYMNNNAYDWDLFYYLFDGESGHSTSHSTSYFNSYFNNNLDDQYDTENKFENIDSFISIINSKKTKQFKYILFSVILDYGIDIGLVHQASLLVDIANSEFIFYEPYGLYYKYGASYANVLSEFIKKIPSKLLPAFYKNNQLNYITYHEKFGLSEGIQQKMIRINNDNVKFFKQDVEQLYNEINKSELSRTQHIIRKINSDTNPVKLTDLTYDSILIVEYFLEHPYNIKIEDKALQIFGNYNSKTCVSITITEMSNFLSLMLNYQSSDVNDANITQKIQAYHNKFKQNPNKQLLVCLYEIILSLNKSEQILNAIGNTNHLKKVCVELIKLI